MSDHTSQPGISREERISDEGLARLDRQLDRGSQVSDPVLTQWIKRYGEPAREVIRRRERYKTELEP